MQRIRDSINYGNFSEAYKSGKIDDLKNQLNQLQQS